MLAALHYMCINWDTLVLVSKQTKVDGGLYYTQLVYTNLK